MYLSKLRINPRWRQARIDLADRYELHRTIMNAFPENIDDEERILYRVEEGKLEPIVYLLVQSHSYPSWETVPRLGQNYLLEPPLVRLIRLRSVVGQKLRFRLQANPTVKRDNKRHALQNDDALLDWLLRKAEAHGFQLSADNVSIGKLGKVYGKKRQQTWESVQFDGFLTVTNVDNFNSAVIQGIGSAKAFGFGMLSIPYPASN